MNHRSEEKRFKDKNRDYFMKGVERSLIHGQGLKGYKTKEKTSSAEKEPERDMAIAKMFLN